MQLQVFSHAKLLLCIHVFINEWTGKDLEIASIPDSLSSSDCIQRVSKTCGAYWLICFSTNSSIKQWLIQPKSAVYIYTHTPWFLLETDAYISSSGLQASDSVYQQEGWVYVERLPICSPFICGSACTVHCAAPVFPWLFGAWHAFAICHHFSSV